ncbi:NudC domain-containing protein 3 [Chionoecetes opilio]|uniref:NudC domain-containing protein 3 n=1 Tax=Chionoecetes opilio TaxID=41210 RepID=A0A8J5CCW7_CHIOP|nr:NudC domain-containing protein 3 [Chionoecetes opilio]
MNPASTPEPAGPHDHSLAQVMAEEGHSLPAFLNAVFGFLARRCPEQAYGGGGGGISGEHLVSQSFCRWRQRYQEEQRALEQLRQTVDSCGLGEPGEVPEAVAEEVVSTDAEEGVEHSGRPAHDQLSQPTPGHNTPRPTEAGGRKGGCNLDTTNGAALERLAWTQSIEDLEVRVIVPPSVTRGRQVKVTVRQSSLSVAAQGDRVTGEGSAWHTLLDGTLPHPVRAEECLWSLVSAEHVAIHLEKCEECWWDRLLTCHDPIDLTLISAEREYGSLPEEDRSKIQEIMWNRLQKRARGRTDSEDLI